ncbi:hypothetical protein Alches_23070 [Alicyclobacillus hesperidum subsp. aegles]|nr:hypothetical protein Alches_23070 [Alicyclobacillus hesperidum subsp. aegles]
MYFYGYPFLLSIMHSDARHFHTFRYLYSIGVHHAPLWLPPMCTRHCPYELRQPGEGFASPG